MLNLTLYKRGMKGSIKLILVLCAVLSIYIPVIISMFEPELAELLDSYVELLPELMAAVGMTAGATSLIGFMCSYLYGFILIIFPMLFCMIRANGLVAKYVDNGSMVSLLTAPVKRRTVAFTQMAVLISGIFMLVVCSTILEYGCAEYYFSGELEFGALLKLNTGLFCLLLLIGGICFLASCFFSDMRYSLGAGVGIPVLMYAAKMLVNMGGATEKAKYFTLFTLFDPVGITAGENSAFVGIWVMLVAAIVLYVLGISVFCKKDLHI